MNRQSQAHSFILQRMHDLLLSQGWCQHAMSVDRDNVPCYIEDKNAWAFSLVGAFFFVLEKYPLMERNKEKALRAILHALNARNAKEGLVKTPADLAKDRESVTDEYKTRFNKFNDAPGRTKMEVVRLLKEAMEG